MIVIKRSCQSCGKPLNVTVGQEMIDGRIVWYESYDCPYCGSRTEVDGKDDTPDEIRNALLAEEGEWGLNISENGPQAIQAIKTLREALGLSLSEAQAAKKKIPGIVATGTRAEMERLRYLLSSSNIQSLVMKVGGYPSS